MHMLKAICAGVVAYVSIIAAWYVVELVKGFVTQRQSGLSTLANYSVPCMVFGLLFFVTGILLLRL